MLIELRISNFAVIDRLSLEFSHGFHVLTGETGAGKSILVDAIALSIGGRASADQIRSDAEEAVLEAAFSLPQTGSLTDRFRNEGVLGLHDTELIVRRVLSRSGRNRLYLNGNLIPLHVIQSLAGTLIDIHGQHEQQSLLSTQAQLDALDAFGHLRTLRDAYAREYERWRTTQYELDEAVRTATERSQREEFLRFQYRELEEANVQPGEEDSLVLERNRLAHAHRLSELAQGAYELLYSGEAAVLGSLGMVRDRLKEIGAIDADTEDWVSLSEGATVQLRELSQRLRDYQESLDQDPARLAQVEERLDRIQRLKKKYGGSVGSLLAKLRELKKQIEDLSSSETRQSELQRLLSEQFAYLNHLAAQLSEGRAGAAQKMENRIKQELAALRMVQTRFQIHVRSDRSESALGPTGRDQVEYLFSANQGEPLLPLARVASGGELSRVMLATKTVLAEADRVPVLIFDEVDSGIGGAVAAVMGRRLKDLASYHQVFCITHLPQVAAQAACHLVVEKVVKQKRTVTRVRQLDQAGRQEEIARMLGGLKITETVRQTAAEMIGEVYRDD
ncbi:MAG TPA: DNA repair protein RecN [Nitrospiraceae bacterium]|nr:DNA repair protein RecN [Nitrospiraceae bacterium]